MSLIDRETHFEFGENWRSYSKTIDQNRIDQAIEGIKKLFPGGLGDRTVLDIGCGSGLHSFAALSVGATSVMAIDIDENSVATTRQLLASRAPNSNWDTRVVSIFDAPTEELGLFDVVYSWGVLHHRRYVARDRLRHEVRKARRTVCNRNLFCNRLRRYLEGREEALRERSPSRSMDN